MKYQISVGWCSVIVSINFLVTLISCENEATFFAQIDRNQIQELDKKAISNESQAETMGVNLYNLRPLFEEEEAEEVCEVDDKDQPIWADGSDSKKKGDPVFKRIRNPRFQQSQVVRVVSRPNPEFEEHLEQRF